MSQPGSNQLKILLEREEIAKAVARIAAEIRQDYQGKRLLLIGVLKGSFIFMSDLVRQLDMDIEVVFVQLASYYSATESSGKVTLIQDIQKTISGKDVVVIEDIVDTGITTNFLLEHLKKKNPASLKLCALVDKPSQHKVAVSIDYLGFSLPNKFIVGYGMDFDEQFRGLPCICCLEK
jgi:hypoxanthine phosphoribosyltransferase